MISKKTPRTATALTTAAKDIMSCSDLGHLKKIIDRGLFEHEIRYLLKLGMDVPIVGARLAPILCSALDHAKDLKRSDELQEDIEQFIELCKLRDGFVIVSATKENLVLHFAQDVIPE